ncbi:hypothetical protein JA1_004286 [Spathaspora sp. JA1]|nr:hypothetical protein JA1_004286 [Spathaspora sp. JA1]
MKNDQIFQSYLVNDALDNYEDPEKYKQWLPKVEAFRKALEDATPDELKAPLPQPIDQLIAGQFNALKHLYDAKLLTPEEFAITDSSGVDLVNKMAKGELTAVEVFKAFAHRAVIAHQFTNCALEFFIDDGLKRAQELDDYFKQHGKTVGPLHGLPISLKEHINYKGRVTSCCYVSQLDNVTPEHGTTAKILEDLGAVYYVRTNQCQTLMQLDSNNNLTGLTKCPYNLLLGSGGSSSGEGAITAFGGSPLGVGSDIGGSVRIPAALSGAIGFRPSSRRISVQGMISNDAGQESVVGVVGPLARTVEDIELWMKAYLNAGKPWLQDGVIVHMPYREVPQPKASDLTIAVMRDDGLVRVSPPVRRALNESVEKLRAAGVTIVEFTPPNSKLIYETVHKMYTCDGNYMQRKLLAESGEPLTRLTKWSLNYGNGSRDISASENRQLNATRDALRTEYTKYLVDNKIDFILGPAYDNVAPHSEEVYNWSYTSMYNLLDFPTLVLQTGICQDPGVDTWTEDDMNYMYRSPLEQLENENYDPNEFVGAPVGLQLAGRRYHDEEVIAAGKTNDEIFQSYLVNDALDNYEDPEKYKQWLPKVEAFRKALEDATPDELKAPLPKPVNELIADQFNAMKYLYDAKLLTPEEFAITDSSGVDLVNKMAKGELTAVEVFKAFAHRAVIAHQFTNCALDFYIDEGLKRAQELDDYYKEHGKTVGPLHGLPISLKEHINVKGRVTSCCYVSMLDNVATEHATTAKILEGLGAVFYVGTNQCQTLMQLDSDNNLTGLSKCPYNLLLGSGGSSSGEGAITAFGGSVLGVGTDIGGSVRIPAALSGSLGFRPSSRRVSVEGFLSNDAGQESVICVAGPLARTVEDIELWMKAYLNEGKPWLQDGVIVHMPYREVPQPKAEELTIAVIRDDGLVRVSPPVRRALNESVEKLKAAGVKIVEFTPPNTKLLYETVHNMYTCDGNYMQRKFLAESGEPLTRLTKWSLNYGSGSRDISASENRKLNANRDALRTEYTKYLVDNKIDFILTPTYNNVAPHSEEVYNWSYTSMYNILDFPTLVLQTGIYQDPSIDQWTEDDKNYMYRSPLEQMENENYDPNEFVGAPVGLQLSGRRYHDEEVIAAGKTVYEIFGTNLLKH